jgi:hypothetical protein
MRGDRMKGEVRDDGHRQQRGEQCAACGAREWSCHVLSAVAVWFAVWLAGWLVIAAVWPVAVGVRRLVAVR